MPDKDIKPVFIRGDVVEAEDKPRVVDNTDEESKDSAIGQTVPTDKAVRQPTN